MSKGAKLKRLQAVRERLCRIEQAALAELQVELAQAEQRRDALLRAMGSADHSTSAGVALLMLSPARLCHEAKRLETALNSKSAAVRAEQSLASGLGRLADAQVALEERERVQQEQAEMLDRIIAARFRTQV